MTAHVPPTCAPLWSITSAQQGQIMIATEAGARVSTFSFARRGQLRLAVESPADRTSASAAATVTAKHDVVVVNFLNRKNAADRRVYELLSEKFQLFEGVFGAR